MSREWRSRMAIWSWSMAGTGWGPKPMVAVDIFRVKDGKVVEHWDVMQEEVSTASGHAMFTKPE